MDQINSNPFFNQARLYQNQATTQQAGSSASRPAQSPSQADSKPVQADSANFSGMFDDDALLKLQSNLEAIAQMAEKSLKRIDAR